MLPLASCLEDRYEMSEWSTVPGCQRKNVVGSPSFYVCVVKEVHRLASLTGPLLTLRLRETMARTGFIILGEIFLGLAGPEKRGHQPSQESRKKCGTNSAPVL